MFSLYTVEGYTYVCDTEPSPLQDMLQKNFFSRVAKLGVHEIVYMGGHMSQTHSHCVSKCWFPMVSKGSIILTRIFVIAFFRSYKVRSVGKRLM